MLIVLGAGLLVILGVKNLQIGGLLGSLLGKKEPEHEAIDVANSIDPDRVDKDGKLIPIGTPDNLGFTQSTVVAIEPPGLLSDPNTVTFLSPQEGKPIEMKLPQGVTSSDVDKIVVLEPGKFVVTVKDSSTINADTINNLLQKYNP